MGIRKGRAFNDTKRFEMGDGVNMKNKESGMVVILGLILAFILGFTFGGITLLNSNDKDCKRGYIKANKQIYKCVPIDMENAPTKE